jgi:hypothetical protein
MKNVKTVILISMMLGIVLNSNCQNSIKKNKLKSVTVTEEKFDVLVKKLYKESETYYDSKGNVAEEITYKQGKVKKHFKYQYDNDNNKIKEEEYDPSGRIIEYSEYKIENGLRIEKIVYDGNKKIKSKKLYQYTTF